MQRSYSETNYLNEKQKEWWWSPTPFWGTQRPFYSPQIDPDFIQEENNELNENELIEEILNIMMGISSEAIQVTNIYETKYFRAPSYLLLPQPSVHLSNAIRNFFILILKNNYYFFTNLNLNKINFINYLSKYFNNNKIMKRDGKRDDRKDLWIV